MGIPTVPRANNAIYKAAQYIMDKGPSAAQDLFIMIDFGVLYTHKTKLQDAYETGWLVELDDGKVDVTAFARKHFESQVPQAKYHGTPAAPRVMANVFTRPPLSPKHIPDSRGTRAGAEYSHRPPGFGFKSIAGGGE